MNGEQSIGSGEQFPSLAAASSDNDDKMGWRGRKADEATSEADVAVAEPNII